MRPGFFSDLHKSTRKHIFFNYFPKVCKPSICSQIFSRSRVSGRVTFWNSTLSANPTITLQHRNLQQTNQIQVPQIQINLFHLIIFQETALVQTPNTHSVYHNNNTHALHQSLSQNCSRNNFHISWQLFSNQSIIHAIFRIISPVPRSSTTTCQPLSSKLTVLPLPLSPTSIRTRA